LAKKKTFPSLLRLFLRDNLPRSTQVLGYARTKMTRDEFHERISQNFECSEEEKKRFLDICDYTSGAYDDSEAFAALAKRVQEFEHVNGCDRPNRIFYLALPPTVFTTVSIQLRKNCYAAGGVNRVVVEKPFGKDLESCHAMIDEMKQYWEEHETFRIDHYLGKEAVKNILPFRFCNPFIENTLNNRMVNNVQITFKEPFGTEGRGGYFDEYGIIRDIQQNHLCQVFSLLAMDKPCDFSAEAVRDMKVKLLQETKPIRVEDTLIGQYVAAGEKPGYKDDDTVPKDSLTPTFAVLVLHVDNDRWRGVPFILKAGKALDESKVEIRVQYDDLENHFEGIQRNELVMRIQPNEALYFKVNTKMPGFQGYTVPVELDLTYPNRFKDVYIPEAYEALIHDCLLGESANFVRDDELHASWSIFTPLLHGIEQGRVPISPYAYGSRGPRQLDDFIYKYGYKRSKHYDWPETSVRRIAKREYNSKV